MKKKSKVLSQKTIVPGYTFRDIAAVIPTKIPGQAFIGYMHHWMSANAHHEAKLAEGNLTEFEQAAVGVSVAHTFIRAACLDGYLRLTTKSFAKCVKEWKRETGETEYDMKEMFKLRTEHMMLIEGYAFPLSADKIHLFSHLLQASDMEAFTDMAEVMNAAMAEINGVFVR